MKKKRAYQIWKRVAASLIDLSIIVLVGQLMQDFLKKTQSFHSNTEITNQIQQTSSQSFPLLFYFYAIFMLLISLGIYYAILWSVNNGQTIGLKLMHLKLVCFKKDRLNYLQSFVRFFISAFLFALFGLDYIWLFLNKEQKSLTDTICQTKIINTKN